MREDKSKVQVLRENMSSGGRRTAIGYARTLLGVGLLVAALTPRAYAADPPHDASNIPTSCAACHSPHKYPVTGDVKTAEGNVNLCQTCHMSGGLAAAKAMPDSEQALPGPGLSGGDTPSGTSHRWDSGDSGHVGIDGANTSTGTVGSGGEFTGRYSKTYTITIATGGDVAGATFNWVDTRGCANTTPVTTGVDVALNDTNPADDPSEGCGDQGITVTFTDETTPSFVAGDIWRVYVRTDINQPTTFALSQRIENGKMMCSTCHNQHQQIATPFDSDSPAYGGGGTGTVCIGGANDGNPCSLQTDCPDGICKGRHFQRIDNDTVQMCLDCHSARDVTVSSSGSHPVGVAIPGAGSFQSPTLLPLDSASQVQCLTCHVPHYAPTSDGSLARESDIVTLCTDCHTGVDTANGSHFDPTTGVLWPGGQYGSPPTTFPAMDASKRGFCTNCHNPHGWVNAGNPTQDYPTLLVANQDELCYTCHDGDPVTTTANVYEQFTGGFDFWTQTNKASGSWTWVNSRHNVSTDDQNNSNCVGPPNECGVVGCANCHNPHYVQDGAGVMDPDDLTTAYTQTYCNDNDWTQCTTGKSYSGGGDTFDYYSATTDFNSMNPIGCTAQPSSIGPAVEDVHGGDDLGISNEGPSTYTGTEDQTYTVTISSTGDVAPPNAEITVTSTGSDSSGPTTVTAFDTFVNVGTLGVQIKFQDGGSGGTASTIGTPTCSVVCPGDHAAATQGTYAGGSDGTYTMVVTTTGTSNNAVLTCSSTAEPCSQSTYTWSDNSWINLGNGVEFLIDDTSGQAKLNDLNETWSFDVTAASGDGLLNEGDTWTIATTAPTAGCSTAAEPDMVTFCLACHDGDPPAGVTIPTNLIDIALEYGGADQHGRIAGNNGGNGTMKAPWSDNGCQTPADCNEAPSDTTNPYAALQCTLCHDQHGTDNIFHLKEQVSVRGQQMWVGSAAGQGDYDQDSGFVRYGNTSYKLPCGGDASPDGTDPYDCTIPANTDNGGTQQDHYWGAWCTFCHDVGSHSGLGEDVSCRSGHMHGGGAF